MAGRLADASFFSFEYSKPITSGMGGLLILNNSNLIKNYQKFYEQIGESSIFNIWQIICTMITYSLFYFKYMPSINRYMIAILRRIGLLYRTSQSELNGNLPNNYPAKLSPVLGVFLYYQLNNIKYINQQKQKQAYRYNQYFKDIKGIKTYYNSNNIYVRYPIVFDNSIQPEVIIKIKQQLLNYGYNFGVWFDDVVHPKHSYRYMYQEFSCINGESISQRIINLPLNINYPLADVDLQLIKQVITNLGK